MELKVDDKIINYMKVEDEDYISITDMLKSKDGNFFVTDWLRNRNTIEFLGIWEELHNPTFNYGEFAIIKSQTGLNGYKLSVKIEKYNEQYNNLKIIYDNTYHDRYFILDKKEVYHSGTSINNAGSKTFSINKITDNIFIKLFVHKVIERLNIS